MLEGKDQLEAHNDQKDHTRRDVEKWVVKATYVATTLKQNEVQLKTISTSRVLTTMIAKGMISISPVMENGKNTSSLNEKNTSSLNEKTKNSSTFTENDNSPSTVEAIIIP